MADGRNELLLAALHRTPRPLTTGEAADAAVGLGESEGWPDERLNRLTRKAVVKLLQHMVTAGAARECGPQLENGRAVPTFEPTQPRDPDYPIPEAPLIPVRDKPCAYADRSKSQLITMLEAQDDVIECFARFIHDVKVQREQLRTKLQAAGLLDS